jgi:hypothetical protein
MTPFSHCRTDYACALEAPRSTGMRAWAWRMLRWLLRAAR